MRISRDSCTSFMVFFLLSHVRCNNCIFIVATHTNTHTHTRAHSHIHDIYTEKYIHIHTILAIYKCISIRQPITCNSAINVVLVQSKSSSQNRQTDSAGEHQKAAKGYAQAKVFLNLKQKRKQRKRINKINATEKKLNYLSTYLMSEAFQT